MGDIYRVIGAEESPYSVKVRTYFRYKGIPHRWMGRAAAGELYERHARLPLVPLVVTPDDGGIQDSTPIIEALEPEFPEPGIHPDDPVAAFVSALLEEFGDEWGNKWMFHFRWAREVDQIACARRLAASMGAGLGVEELETAARSVVTAPQIERSFQDAIDLVERHLIGRPYLFGGRPAFADFGLWGQIYNARRDPTPAAIVATAPRVNQWIDRMLLPTVEGEFEPWSALAPTLMPLLEDQVGALFLPWSAANAAAIAGGDEEFTVSLKGNDWTQKPQKYHARSLAALKAKYEAAKDAPGLRDVLGETGCLDVLEG